MPIYVYHCSNCGYQFEQNQSFSDPPLKRCPDCDKLSLNKVFTPVTVIYKGSGFYSTDHHSSSGTSKTSSTTKKEEKTSEKKVEPSGESSKAKETPAKKENSTT